MLATKESMTSQAEIYFGKGMTGGAVVSTLDEDNTWLVRKQSHRQRSAADLDRQLDEQLASSPHRRDRARAKKRATEKKGLEQGVMKLQQAIEGGDWEMCRKLAVNGIEKATVNGRSMLSIAMDRWIADGGSFARRQQGVHLIRSEKVVKMLLVAKVDVDWPDSKGGEDTPLHTAAWYGEIDMVKCLLEMKADPLRKNIAEETPVMKAERSLEMRLENLQVEEGADVVPWFRKGIQVIHGQGSLEATQTTAAELEDRFDQVIGCLQNYQAQSTKKQVKIRKSAGPADERIKLEMAEKTRKAKLSQLLFNSVHSKDIESIRKLVEDGANVDTLDHDGWTPLLVSTVVDTTQLEDRDQDGHTDAYTQHIGKNIFTVNNAVCQCLLDLNADPTYACPRGTTPLHEAVRSDNLELISMLCTSRPAVSSYETAFWAADVNAIDMNNDSPLHLAAAKGDRALVTSLLDRGANMGIRNKSGYTPYMLATHCHHADVAEDLRLRLYIRKYSHFLRDKGDDRVLHQAARKIQRMWLYWRKFRRQKGSNYAHAVFTVQQLYWDVQASHGNEFDDLDLGAEDHRLVRAVRSCGQRGCHCTLM